MCSCVMHDEGRLHLLYAIVSKARSLRTKTIAAASSSEYWALSLCVLAAPSAVGRDHMKRILKPLVTRISRVIHRIAVTDARAEADRANDRLREALDILPEGIVVL